MPLLKTMTKWLNHLSDTSKWEKKNQKALPAGSKNCRQRKNSIEPSLNTGNVIFTMNKMNHITGQREIPETYRLFKGGNRSQEKMGGISGSRNDLERMKEYHRLRCVDPLSAPIHTNLLFAQAWQEAASIEHCGAF